MSYRKVLLTTLVALLGTFSAASSQAQNTAMVTANATKPGTLPSRSSGKERAWRYPASLDAVIAAPKSHKVLFENDRVRVLEVTIPPHSREPVHTHQWPSIMYMDVPSKFRYYDASGKLLFEAGEVVPTEMNRITTWLKPEAPHSVENITDIPYHAIRVELKK